METNPKVLVVDDDNHSSYNDAIDYLKEMFEQKGYTFNRTFNGKEALDSVLKESPDVIVSDLNMPVMDGITLFKELRDRNLNMIYILMSNNPNYFYGYEISHGKSSEEYGERGIDAFLDKGDLFQLPDLIDRLLSRSRQ